MIKKLHIKNFLSLRDVEVNLGQTNVCVGANMSGKSALIKALKFLSFLTISELNNNVRDFGGFFELAWKGEKREPIIFYLEGEYSLDPGEKKREFEYYLEFYSTPQGDVSIKKEKLGVKIGAQRKVFIVDLKDGKGKVIHTNKKEAFKAPGSNNSILHYDVPGWEGTNFKNSISLWRFYDLNPASMKKINSIVRQYYLSGNGDNLASWLLTLQTEHSDCYKQLMQAARDAFPSLKEVNAPPTSLGTTFLKSREEYLHSDVSVFHMSDGELKYIALLSLIFAPHDLGSPLIAVEEPETNLHPRLLESLVTVFRQARKALGENLAQVLISTHSPKFVDLFQLEDILVFEKQRGCTNITRPSSKTHLRKLLTEGELSLGDLFYSGALSGK